MSMLIFSHMFVASLSSRITSSSRDTSTSTLMDALARSTARLPFNVSVIHRTVSSSSWALMPAVSASTWLLHSEWSVTITIPPHRTISKPSHVATVSARRWWCITWYHEQHVQSWDVPARIEEIWPQPLGAGGDLQNSKLEVKEVEVMLGTGAYALLQVDNNAKAGSKSTTSPLKISARSSQGSQ